MVRSTLASTRPANGTAPDSRAASVITPTLSRLELHKLNTAAEGLLVQSSSSFCCRYALPVFVISACATVQIPYLMAMAPRIVLGGKPSERLAHVRLPTFNLWSRGVIDARAHVPSMVPPRATCSQESSTFRPFPVLCAHSVPGSTCRCMAHAQRCHRHLATCTGKR